MKEKDLLPRQNAEDRRDVETRSAEESAGPWLGDLPMDRGLAGVNKRERKISREAEICSDPIKKRSISNK